VNRNSLEAHPEVVFDAQRDSPEAIAESIKSRGIAYVKNAIDRDIAMFCAKAVVANARALSDMIGKVVNDMPLCFADRHMEGDEKYVGLFGRKLADFKDPLTFSGMDRSWYYEGVKNYKRWFWQNGDRFPNLLLSAVFDSILPSIYVSHFGGECFTSYEADAVRYQRPDIRHLSYFFHQDGNYQSRDPNDHVGITTWIPLVDSGEEAPGLQFYPHKLRELMPLPEGVKPPYLFADEAYCLDRFGDTLWAPMIPAGTVVIFDSFCVHRTFITGDMTRERQSADVRIFPVRGAPEFVRQSKSWSVTFPLQSALQGLE
jgi:hypothetical protein